MMLKFYKINEYNVKKGIYKKKSFGSYLNLLWTSYSLTFKDYYLENYRR